jgi:type II secretory pathway component GspD/PulD (secretin)
MNAVKVTSILISCGIFFLTCSIKVFGESSILIDTSTGRITVKATREKLAEIEKMIPQFPVETRQIQIKARALEVSQEVTEEFGTYLERLTGVEVPVETEGEGTTLKYGPETLTEVETGVGALTFTFYRLVAGEEKFEAILNMLIKQKKARLLSEPQITTISGEVAGMYAVQDIPYVKIIKTEEEGEEITEVEPKYSTVGMILQVLPKIVGGDLVQMSILPIIAELVGYETFMVDTILQRLPILSRRVAPTNITVKSGEPIVIGGLLSKKKTKVESRFPILSGLPVVGSLFKSRYEKEEDVNILITVKPHILKPREIRGRAKRIFTFQYALAEEVAPQISEIISPQGMMEINPKEAPPNSVLVRDNEDQMKVIQDVITKIGTYPQQRREKVFGLRYSSPEPTKEVLLPLLSSRGAIKIDKKTNSLVVEDGAYQLSKIEKAISSVEMSNQIPQKKIFHLKYAKEAEVVPLLEKFLSPQGSIRVEEESLVVEDNNWVIQQVTEEIKRLDDFETQKKTELYPLKYVKAEDLSQSREFKKVSSALLCDKATIAVNPEKNALIITALGWRWPQIEEMVARFDTYQPKKLDYKLKYALASSLARQLQSFLSDKRSLEVVPEQNSLSVMDSEYHLELIGEKLTALDDFEKQKKRKVLYLKYASLSQIIEIVEKMKSSRPGL